jgi:glycerol kinase
LGSAYLAGLAAGFWKDMDEIAQNREVDKVFKPQIDDDTREKIYAGWKKAVLRSMDWEEH